MTEDARPKPADLPRDWPHFEASRVIDCHPHRWHVQQMGQGPDIVLLHGAGASCHSWRHLIGPLSRSHRVTAFDLAGQGFTRAGTRSRCSLPLMAQDIARLLGQIGVDAPLLVGHSAGAALALQLALAPNVAARGVVAINGALENFKGMAGWLFPAMARLMALNPFTALMLATGDNRARVDSLLRATGTKPDEETRALYQRLLARRSHIDATLAMMAQWSLDDLNALLPQIAQPVLFLHGDKDAAVSPEIAHRACARVGHGRLVILEGIGHLAPEECPDLICAQVLEFAQQIGA